MSHKTNVSKTAVPVISVQMTQADATGAKGQALSNTRIYIIDANGAPTGDIMESGVAGSVPTSGSGGSPSIVPLWTATTALDAGAQVRATVAIGGFVVGEYISSNSSRTTGTVFNSSEASFFTSVPEDTTIVKKSEVVNVLTSTATDVPISAGQAKVLQDTKAPLASPPLTGIPTAPTAATSTNTTQIATAAFTQAVVAQAVQGLQAKDPVKVATTVNITLSGVQNIDGINAIGSGDRVLVKNQTTASQNGIYDAAPGAWARAADFDGTPVGEVKSGSFCFVQQGTTNADSAWELTTDGTITIGTTALTFTQFTGAGQLTATAPLTKTGNTLAISAATGALPGSMSAVDKTKIDTIATNAAALATTGTPVMDGTAALGVATTAAKSDHVHPSDTSRATVTSITDGSINALFDRLRWDFATQLAASTNLDTLSISGFYDGTSLINAPNASAGWFYILHQRHSNNASADWSHQTAYTLGSGTTAGEVYIRTEVSGVWTAWTRIDNAALPALSSTTPAMDGVGAVGTGTTTARADHVHPSDTSRAPLVSPTFTGTVIADGTLRLGDGQNLGDSGTGLTAGTAVFPNVVSTSSTTIANADTALRVSRPGTSGTKWGNTLDVNIGSHTAGLNSQTQVDFRLNNGGTNVPDMTALTLRGDGQVLLNSNPTAALGAATKQYVDGLTVGLLDYRGAFTPAVSSGATGYPTTGGSGTSGAILKGDVYFASAAGFILTEAIQAGDSVVAKIDSPGQTAANWEQFNENISYVPEDAANKVTAFSSPTDTQYPSAKLVNDNLVLKAPLASPSFTGDITMTDTAAGIGPVFKLANDNYALADKAQVVFEHGSIQNAQGIIQSNLPGNNDVDLEFFTTNNAILNTAPAMRLTGNNTMELANALPLAQGGTGSTSLKTVGGIAVPGTGDIPFPTFATSLRLMNPADIIEDANRAIYLLADDLALGAVSTWPNPGTGGDFLQATAGSQPTVVAVPALGNRRAALFADDFMETATNISLGTNYGLFAVFMITSLAETNQYILSEPYGGSTVEYTFGIQGSQFFAGHFNGAWRQHVTGSPLITTPYIMAASYNGANISIAIDGAAATSTAQTSNPTLTEAGNIRLGRRWDGVTDIFDGHIACVVAKSGAAFTATELEQLQGWAAWYYGRVSALPVGHTYKTVPPMITA